MKEEKIKKYEEVSLFIKKYIKENGMCDGDKLPTEKELTEICGVSNITVKRALKELSDNNEVYRVQGGGTYLGRTKNSLKNNTGISFIPIIGSQDTVTNRFIEIIKGAESYLYDHYYYVTFHSTKSAKNEREVIQNLIEKGAKCLIILPNAFNDNLNYYLELTKSKIPIIYIDNLPYSFTGNLIKSDNIYGGYLAAKHLIINGYKKIAFLSYQQNLYEYSVFERIKGYRLALEESGIEYNPDLVFYENINIENTISKILLNKNERPDSFFCVNDILAVGVSNILKKRNLKIPGDFGIIGFDDLEIASAQDVPISTVRQDFHRIGYYAAKLALETINEETDVYSQKIIPVSLIARESTKKGNP